MKKTELIPKNPDNKYLKEYTEDMRKGEVVMLKMKIVKMKDDIKSVLNFLEGTTEREKIANYIREYLLDK